MAAHLIDDFKNEYRRRFPGRDAAQLTDKNLMREVLNPVGKKGKLGEHVRYVISVSMLTEGWDANTVTHILGGGRAAPNYCANKSPTADCGGRAMP